MVAWVDGASSFFGGSIADMGPYIGPWPLMPSGVTDGLNPADYDEIDFYLVLPNPATPGNVATFADGSYPTQIFDAYRYMNGGTPPPTSFLGWYTSQAGGASVPDGSTPPPGGYHLVVVTYIGASAPFNTPSAYPPEHYVPASYAASGTAAFLTEPGGWSSWQPGIDETITNLSFGTSGTNWATTGSGADDTENPSGLVNLVTLAGTAVSTILGTGTAGAGTSVGAPFIGVSAAKTNASIFGPASTEILIEADQRTAVFDADVSNPYPPPLLALVDGVDYGDIPFGGGTSYEFASPDPAVFDWDTLHTEQGGERGGTTGTGGSVFPLTSHVVYEILSSPVSVGNVGLVTGTALASVAVSSDDTWTSTWGIPTDIALPSGLPTEIVVSAASGFLGSGITGEVVDIAPDGTYGWDAAQAFTGADYHYTTSQWRYWLVNPIVPASVGWRGWGIPA